MYLIPLQATLPPEGEAPNALNGKLGECLDSLIVYGETMVWGGTTATGESWSGVGGLMVGTAAALGAVFAVVLAGKMAYSSMAKGKPIDVLDLLKPIMIAFILSNWYVVTSSLYGIFKPVENRFRSVYVWSNERVDSLRDRRLLLKEIVEGEIEELEAEAIISEIRQRRGIVETDEEKEKKVADGDANQTSMSEAYTDTHFGDVLNNDVNTDTDKQGLFDWDGFLNQARMFHWAEDGIIWVGEVIWGVSLYVIFIIKYLLLYVLVMFGPIWFACSILDVWEDSWSEWLGKFVVVGFYGTMAYLALIFGLMLIEAATVADINTMEYAMLDDERFTAYIKKTGMMDGFAQLTLYVTAVCVTAVSLSLSFELASLAFPGDIGRGVASLYKGMIKYIETKAQQVKEVAQEVAVGTAITVATGGAAAAAAVTKHMADRNERERERDHIADVDKDLKDKAEEGASQQAQDTSSTHFKTRDEMEREYRERQMQAEEKDDWVLAAEKADLEAKAQAELEKQMGGPDSPTVKLSHMAEAAYSWADRLAYLRAFASTHKYCAEDIMADIRDAHKVAEAETKGIKDEFLQMREERLKENMFLMDMVQKQGLNTNSRFTFKERMAVKFFGEAKGAWLSLTWRQKLAKALLSEAKAEKYLRGSIYSKQMHGTPRLTSWGALFGRDTLSSPKQDREMLKRLGIYKDVMRAEMLRRMANSFIRPSVRPKVKFLGITIRKEKPVFRNWLHKKLYKSCMKNLATTEALIALRCREILADRDVHINGMGKAIFLPNADLYWRRDIDFEAMREAQQKRGATEFNNQQAQWFYDRYGSLEEARKMQMELEVFDTIRRVNDADDFIVERQLKALDETEIRLWKDINENYHSYRRVKENIEKIILSYDRNS